MNESETNAPLWLAILALAEQATRDHLTGLHNRRYFEETLADHVEAARRYGRELSLVLFDIDHFKKINDTHGHDAGDAALRAFAEKLNSTARKADIICRYGGDEFAVILPETSREQAERFVERMQRGSISPSTADNESPDCSRTQSPPFTAGIATLPCDNLVATADADLLRKKRIP